MRVSTQMDKRPDILRVTGWPADRPCITIDTMCLLRAAIEYKYHTGMYSNSNTLLSLSPGMITYEFRWTSS